MSLLNTNMQREKDNLARMLIMARDYARSKGFKGTFYIEPKPMEPSKHQYDFDAETVIGFLKANGLEKDFALNIEANHAELAGHDFYHELTVAVDNGMLGSIDANRGDPETDGTPTSSRTACSKRLSPCSRFAWAASNRRTELRRENPQKLHRPGRPVHRPHRRHGCIRLRS